MPAIARAPAPEPARRGRRVSRIVVTLGFVSLFTDLSSEMVVAILPVYLTLGLGLSPVQYGIVDGLYQGVTAGVRIVGGIMADLTRRPKVVAVIGYGVSCLAKLFFLSAHGFGSVLGLVAIDRSGKGLRTAPRDAMIVAASEPASLGYSFGVHRAMDTAGALGGPLIAFAVTAWLVDGYDVIFVLSFGLAAIGLAVLVLFVPDRSPDPEPAAPAGLTAEPAGVVRRGALRRTVRELGTAVGSPGYRRLLAAGALLSLATISDGFVYLTLKDRVGLGPRVFPLLFVGAAVAFLLLAVPLGRLADRVGRTRVFLGGHVAAGLGYLGLWLLPAGPALVIGVLLLTGTFYAATDGVLPALAAPIVPEAVRASGIAGVQTMMAVGSMASTAAFGLLWSTVGQSAAVGCFAVGLIVAVLLAVGLLRPVRTP